MCTTLARSYIRLFNYLLGLIALGLLGLFTYLSIKNASIFTYLCLSLSGYILIVSVIGHYTATGRGGCGVVYIFIFTLFILFEGVVVCAFVFASDKTISFLEDTDTAHKEAVESAKHWVEDHTAVISTVGIIWLSVQVLTLIITGCSYQRLASDYRRATEGDGPLLQSVASDDDDQLRSSKSSSTKRSVSSTPQSDAHRQKMAEKYGRYGIRSSSSNSNDVSDSSSINQQDNNTNNDASSAWGGGGAREGSHRGLSSSRSVELGTSR